MTTAEAYVCCNFCSRNPQRIGNCALNGQPDRATRGGCSQAMDIPRRRPERQGDRDWQNPRRQAGQSNTR